MITLAADLGGTRIKLGVVIDGKLAAQHSIPANSGQGLKAALPAVADELDRLLSACGPKLRANTIGLTFPGLVAPGANKIVATYGKWDDARDIDFDSWAKSQFDVPLVMENDGRLALLGEWQAGAGTGCRNLVLVTLGTGLGTSAVIEGKLLKGVHGQAGVLGGHFATNRQGAKCTCGNIGCAETEASTWILSQIAKQHPDFQTSLLGRRDSIDFQTVFALAAGGDACAKALKTHSIAVWAQMIVNLVHAYDPERVILGGGIVAGADDFFELLKETVLAHAHTPWGKLQLVAGTLGSSAALLGLDAMARTPELL